MALEVAKTINEAREAVKSARQRGERIALVPTMGALHAGHASLIRAARNHADFIAVSIFVNPTQFGPKEDFARYPRTWDADLKICEAEGAQLVFAPTVEEMYPQGFSTFVEVQGLQDPLCGVSRPGHFRGVSTVVLKLFNIMTPDVALFGAKDYQQSRIIQRMAEDLNLTVTIQVEPTIREPDGLAMSSRNAYLSPEQRALAPAIYRALRNLETSVLRGLTDVAALEQILRDQLTQIPGARLDYARIVNAQTLEPIALLDRPAVAAVAIFLGSTRLIDNILLRPPGQPSSQPPETLSLTG